MTDVAVDQEEQLARIQRMQEETRKFVSEQHKLQAEAAKLIRDRDIAPWQIAFGGMATGAALVGATAAFIKVFG